MIPPILFTSVLHINTGDLLQFHMNLEISFSISAAVLYC